MKDSERVKNTEQFLMTISHRLSGREDLRGCNYRIEITPGGSILMNPVVYVYPNRYRRCETDKLDIISFISSTYLNDNHDLLFVPGHYIYQSSAENKKRRWTREGELV